MAFYPWSYSSWKTVITHMEANKRFELAHKCPSLRVAERTSPLKIERLVTEKNNTFSINEVTYSLKVFVQYLDNRSRPMAKLNCERGGVDHDVNRYGGRDFDSQKALLPGDINLRRRSRSPDEDWTASLRRRNYREEIKKLKIFLNWMTSLATRLGSLADHDYQKLDTRKMRRCQTFLQETNIGQEVPEDQLHSVEFELSFQQIYRSKKEDMEAKEEYLEPSLHKRNKTKPLFEAFIHLYVTKDGRTLRMERVKYDKKLHKAVKYLFTKFFEGRIDPVNIETWQFRTDKILRFPVDLKIRIPCMIVTSDDFCRGLQELLSPLLDASSGPLEYLYIEGTELYCGDMCGMLKSAKQVVMHNCGCSQNWLFELLELECTFYQNHAANFLTTNGWLAWINDVVQKGREAGTCFIFGLPSAERIDDVFTALNQQYLECQHDAYYIIILMENGLSLHVQRFSTDTKHVLLFDVLHSNQATTPAYSTISVINLPTDVNMNQLREVFEVYPGFRSVDVQKKNTSCVAFIQYSDLRSAMIAMMSLQDYEMPPNDSNGFRIELVRNKTVDPNE